MLKRSYSFDMTGLCTRCSSKFYSIGDQTWSGYPLGGDMAHVFRMQNSRSVHIEPKQHKFQNKHNDSFLSRLEGEVWSAGFYLLVFVSSVWVAWLQKFPKKRCVLRFPISAQWQIQFLSIQYSRYILGIGRSVTQTRRAKSDVCFVNGCMFMTTCKDVSCL